MAFKNLMLPNQASATRFKKSTSGMGGFANSAVAPVSSEQTNPYNGLGCLKCITPGGSWSGIWFDWPTGVDKTLTYSFSIGAYIEKATTFRIYIGTTGNDSKIVSANAGYNIIKNENYVSSNGNGLLILTPDALSIYMIYSQLENNSTATSYEFPGLDLTGNSITSNEAVQNLKLNQQLKMFAIASGEQVRNITVENILQLLQVPSSEYVNNLEICNSIFLEAIESTETVNELIAWVACEFMKCNITMKTPKTILKMKYPR